MKIIAAEQSKQDNYKLMIGSIVPRPIALVTSVSADGVANAAPFSYFNIVGVEPPLLMVSSMRKPHGVMKDTAVNVTTTKEFIVHVVSKDIVEQTNTTSLEAPPDVDELEMAGLATIAGEHVQVPRIRDARIAMECRLVQHLPVGMDAGGSPTSDVLIGEVIAFHIDDDLYADGRIDVDRLQPISRLAGVTYATIGETFYRARPSYAEWLQAQPPSRP